MREYFTVDPRTAAHAAEIITLASEAQLRTLAMLRDIVLRQADKVDRKTRGLMTLQEETDFGWNGDPVAAATHLERSARRLVAMEREILGLRQPPVHRAPASSGPETPRAYGGGRESERERDDLADRGEYDDLDEADDLESAEDFPRDRARPVVEIVAEISEQVGVAPPDGLIVPPAKPAAKDALLAGAASFEQISRDRLPDGKRRGAPKPPVRGRGPP